MRVTKWFGTVDEFLQPLVENLNPVKYGNATVRSAFDALSGRLVGWLSLSYGADNIKKFISIADAIGFDNLIQVLQEHKIKTLGRFSNLLDELIIELNIKY